MPQSSRFFCAFSLKDLTDILIHMVLMMDNLFLLVKRTHINRAILPIRRERLARIEAGAADRLQGA
jgi:hypothetical protein